MTDLNRQGQRRKFIIILLAIGLAGGSFVWGLVYSRITTAPEIIVRTVTKDVAHYIEIEKPEVQVVEKVVEKPVVETVPVVKYVEVEKEVPMPLDQFASEDELVAWLQTDKTDELPYIKDLFECENFARTLMVNTLHEGHYMSIQVLKNYTRSDTGEFIAGPHVINSTIIGNYIYFIEPQTDEFWKAYVLEK